MNTEGGQTPGGEPGAGGAHPGGAGREGTARRTEGDLLSERRARRAAEFPEPVLIRRAEAAEATVQTLETHVASLRQRLQETEEERRALAERLDAGAAPGVSGGPASRRPASRRRASETALEHELQRVKQREYAEQRLRIDAENRCIDLDRRSHAEIEHLNQRLGAGEREARMLASRLESVQRALDEAEQAAATERQAVRRAEQQLQARLAELEGRAIEIQRGLGAERIARERSESLLEEMRRGHRRAEGIVGEMRLALAHLSAAASARIPAQANGRDRGQLAEGGQPEAALVAAPSPPQQARAGEAAEHRQAGPGQAGAEAGGVGQEGRSSEMADALAEAAERLRARAQAGEGAEDTERGAVSGAQQPLAMSPSREPLLAGRGVSWWAAWRARARARRQRKPA